MSDPTILIVGFIGGAVIGILIVYLIDAWRRERKVNRQINERLRGMRAELQREKAE